MGIASVATDIPGCRQVVADGSNGLLVPVGDPPALAAAIGRLLRSADMRHTMGARGRTIAATTFDELAVFATLEHEYARLIRQKRLAPALAQPIEVTPA
jgi:glycosyltransferase involved in cell wall biosynthesis